MKEKKAIERTRNRQDKDGNGGDEATIKGQSLSGLPTVSANHKNTNTAEAVEYRRPAASPR